MKKVIPVACLSGVTSFPGSKIFPVQQIRPSLSLMGEEIPVSKVMSRFRITSLQESVSGERE